MAAKPKEDKEENKEVKVEKAEEIKEETKTNDVEFKVEEPIIEPVKPLTYEDIHEKINPTIKEETPVREEPVFEIKTEEEIKSNEPKRNIFGDIIEEDDIKKDVKLSKAFSSNPEEADAPISLDEIKPFEGEPVGSLSGGSGIEIVEDDKDEEDFVINLKGDDEDFTIDVKSDDDEDFTIDVKKDEEDDFTINVEKENTKKTSRSKKNLFDADDDDVVKFPKF